MCCSKLLPHLRQTISEMSRGREGEKGRGREEGGWGERRGVEGGREREGREGGINELYHGSHTDGRHGQN